MAAIIVHGGAWDIPDSLVADHEKGCHRALSQGYRILAAGGESLDAAVAAVRVLEDDPTFDAGLGSFLNAAGEVELDAAVMSSTGMRAGAVAGVKRIRNPVEVARQLLLEGDAVLLVADGAEEFARESGLPLCAPTELHLAREVRRFHELRENGTDPLASFGPLPGDTVGAVAVDDRGEVTVAVSTGGRPLKPKGRVGDSPIIGAGLVAEEGLGAVCCTGWGEGILRISMARMALDRLAELPPETACQAAVQALYTKVGGRGGVIAATPRGEVAFAFNTPRMAVGYRTALMEEGIVRVESSPTLITS